MAARFCARGEGGGGGGETGRRWGALFRLGGDGGGDGGRRGFRVRGLGVGGSGSSSGSSSVVGSTRGSSASSGSSASDSISGGATASTGVLGLFLLPGGLPRPFFIGGCSSAVTGIVSPAGNSAIGILLGLIIFLIEADFET